MAEKPARRTLKLTNLPPKGEIKTGPRTPSRIDPNNPPWPAYRGYHEYSFAHATMGVRLPTILGKAIDDVWRTVNETSEEDQIVDLVDCVERMDVLMTDLSQNNKLRFIIDDGEGDIPLWNKEIAKYFQGKDFMTAPWLFAEAYKYRRLHECFSISKYWKDYDVFFRQKCDTFSRSSQAVFELSTRFATPFSIPDASKEAETVRLMFRELTQVCLWGNSTDLSLLINMTEEDIKKLQSTGGDHLAATERTFLAMTWTSFAIQSRNSRVAELISCLTMLDLSYTVIAYMASTFYSWRSSLPPYPVLAIADFLIQSGLASQVRFHGKRFAWFVSDVTRKDWDWLLNSCVYGNLFPTATEEENASLKEMGKRWKQYEKEGKWVYEQHAFWCTGFTFWDLHSEAPDLFLHLSKSDLVIFKGDLNHRKLTYDCHAPANTPFDESIGPMASAAGAPRVCSLRTIKSDVVVGLESNAMAEKLDKEEPGWKISGKYAVVLLSEDDQVKSRVLHILLSGKRVKAQYQQGDRDG
ncbi:hypothetical protein RHS01_09246 [Rhizoctonia solani]|uniref:Sugar phosphate phosphatase n=1 Tax=Rhizoctonia solani TaxID=456999 RepID=A0A8H7I7H1_9AGAM|nr:hypothetical protein RHS01_09246 [Rhizoctonia solani]